MLPCSALWALGAVAPVSSHVLGSVPGLGYGLASWGHKSHFAHMLHPSSMSSLLSSALLLCTSRGKVIFCLKHCLFFFLIYIFIPEGKWIVLSPWKRGAGAPGGRVGNPCGTSAAVTAGLSGCHLIKPCLLYMTPAPNSAPWGKCPLLPPWAKLVCHHPWGLRSLLQHPGKGTQHEEHPDADTPALLPVGAQGCPGPGTAMAQWARGTGPAWQGALLPDSPSSSVNQIANSSLQRRNWASW